MNCYICKNEINNDPDSISTGYGVDKDNNKVCYPCCADQDYKHMQENDKITLYLSKYRYRYNNWDSLKELCQHHETDQGPYVWFVSNWPGSLEIKCTVKTGRHNWGLTRYDAWFKDKFGQCWHGVQYGDNTQLIHCKKIKSDRAKW